MAISAQPATFGSSPLKPLFDALGLSSDPDPIIVKSAFDDNDAANGNVETLDFTKREISVRERVLNLINANNPNAALDVMQATSFDDPDLFEAIADDVYEALDYAGFDKDAEELKRMSPELAYKPDETKADHTIALQSLVM